MKFLLSIALALGVAATAYAAAASLQVNGGTIQYGEDSNLTCTQSANVLGWVVEVGDGTANYDASVSKVRIAVNGDCAGNSLFVAITDGNGNEIAWGRVGTITNPQNVVVNFEPDLDPADIEDIHIWIEGPNSSPDVQ